LCSFPPKQKTMPEGMAVKAQYSRGTAFRLKLRFGVRNICHPHRKKGSRPGHIDFTDSRAVVKPLFTKSDKLSGFSSSNC